MSQRSGCTWIWTKEVDADFDSFSILEALRDEPYRWLLDSAMQKADLGRYSFAGAGPYALLRSRGTSVRVDCLRGARPDLDVGVHEFDGSPFDWVRRFLPPPLASGQTHLDGVASPFLGGVVGYWGYELAQHLEPVRLSARDDLGLSELVLLFVDQLVVFDHERNRCWFTALGFGGDPDAATSAAAERGVEFERQCREALGVAAADARTSGEPMSLLELTKLGATEGATAFFDEHSYAEAVSDLRGEIAAGSVYQTNLTHRMSLDCAAEPVDVYRELRAASPAPFAAYLELPDVAILSSSPERFLRLSAAGEVESRPIKGTRPRGLTPGVDADRERELRESEKDAAENLMIVDLVRNDLGRVCEVGSVEVTELREIERYSSVFQLVSTVVGKLRGDCDVIDLIRAAFPPGSMTGAPKIAAMEHIDRVEPVRRGIYSGALGYLDVRGGADLSVVIRTLLVVEGRAYVHVGGGIVIDSDPVAEYRETLDKARALIASVRRASKG